jgi:hypothetical protein
MKMLSGPVMPQKQQQAEVPVELQCCECKRKIDFYYGRYQDGGVCSRECDILHMKEKKGEMLPVSPAVPKR